MALLTDRPSWYKAAAGAGRNLAEARKPAVVYTEEGRVLTFAIGSVSSGVPTAWAAAEHKPGVNLIEPIPKNVPLIREMVKIETVGIH